MATCKDPSQVRDPRTDPQPRDVVRSATRWRSRHREVVVADDGRVHYESKGGRYAAPGSLTLTRWRRWAAGGEVLARAEDVAS